MVAVGIGFGLLTEKYIGDLGLVIGWIIGIFSAGILILGLQRLSPYLEKLIDYTNAQKSYPYTEKFGKDYPQPTPEEFGITQEEFKDYNSRFQFDFIKLIFTYGLWIATCFYVIQSKVEGHDIILLMGGVGMLAIVLNYLFNYWNKKISQKHRYYEKIHKFQESIKIYFKISHENSDF